VGGLGLILPAVTGIAPILTPLAATGLAIIMVLAAATHVRRKEPSAVVFTLVLVVAPAHWFCRPDPTRRATASATPTSGCLASKGLDHPLNVGEPDGGGLINL